jgi:hypothetical protein
MLPGFITFGLGVRSARSVQKCTDSARTMRQGPVNQLAKGIEEHVAVGVRSVLIVDDNPDVFRTFARMPQSSGYAVLTALDAESVLHRLAAGHPYAALVDLRLPAAWHSRVGCVRRRPTGEHPSASSPATIFWTKRPLASRVP